MGRAEMSGRRRQICEQRGRWRFAGLAGERRGLSLLGLMVCLSFLVIVLVGIVAAGKWARWSGRQRLSRQCLASVAEALWAYKESEGEFPPAVSSNAELVKYLESAGAARECLEDMGGYVFRDTSQGREILDGWGRPLRYVFEGGAGQRPELLSAGPDEDDPTDDIYAEGLKAVFMKRPTGRRVW